jgi:hypothetical protein
MASCYDDCIMLTIIITDAQYYNIIIAYLTNASMQAELSPVAMSLAPGDMGPPDKDLIPYVALDNAAGWEVIASGSLVKAGLYHVEETCSEQCYR